MSAAPAAPMKRRAIIFVVMQQNPTDFGPQSIVDDDMSSFTRISSAISPAWL